MLVRAASQVLSGVDLRMGSRRNRTPQLTMQKVSLIDCEANSRLSTVTLHQTLTSSLVCHLEVSRVLLFHHLNRVQKRLL